MNRLFRCTLVGVVSILVAAPVAVGSPGATRGDAPHHLSGLVKLDSAAADLRVSLDRLLAEHAFLTIEQMRSGLRGAPDFAAAAVAVEANSTAVANAIGSIYGQPAVAPFGEIWRSHIGYLVDYAIAIGKDDSAGKQNALDGLAEYRAKVHTFLIDANPGVALGGINDALDMHTAQLIAFIDKEHAGDHEAAYGIEREAYPHMFEVGDALAKVIANKFADRYTGMDVAYSSAGTLRVTLDRLLGEHAFLAAEAMRAGVAGEPYFAAAKSALEANSADLAALIKAAYGQDAATKFAEMWRGHIQAYLSFIDATRSKDDAAKNTALDGINNYVGQLANFLAAANPNLDAAATAQLLRQHAQHLIDQVVAFGKGNYDATYAIVRDGYAHMFMVGEALAAAIARQFPAKFPANVALPATDTLPTDAVAVSDRPLFTCPIGGLFERLARAISRP
jgi:hypothetical protein